MGENVHGIFPDALEILESYHYPGNVRELENIIARCVALETSDMIRRETLPQLMASVDSPNFEHVASGILGLDHLLETVEKKTIEKALTQAGGNKNEAAKLLGITHRSLRYRLAKHGLSDETQDGEVIEEEKM